MDVNCFHMHNLHIHVVSNKKYVCIYYNWKVAGFLFAGEWIPSDWVFAFFFLQTLWLMEFGWTLQNIVMISIENVSHQQISQRRNIKLESLWKRFWVVAMFNAVVTPQQEKLNVRPCKCFGMGTDPFRVFI